MTESDYWLHLEYRLGREFAGMSENHLRFLWCDGFTPVYYLLSDAPPRITGEVWICNGQVQSKWSFTLFLPFPVTAHETLDWASLLPPENVTRWLAIDEKRKRIEIEPSAATPDFDEKTARNRSPD